MTDASSPDFWNAAYLNDMTAWDLGGAAPVFIRLLEDRAFPPGKMIVLGAGKGYDARLFARHGFDVTAVDFAPEAIREMQQLARPNEPFTALQADLFELPKRLDGTFDYVLEYVCYCAIDPTRRHDYARVVERLLRPGGLFVGVMFPLGNHCGGPPFAVDTDELADDLTGLGLDLVDRRAPEDSIRPRRGREELLMMRKPAD